ncbi:2-oxoacid:acceptor oxidoreductase subunit alpha [Geomonas sp. Red69]|uniref:2-oxoacid:acceptor oxidoreductase subunit alpha n=1 Tax=Geomonas diazotrophica TaxID=2843197 RepID=A0ABX8JQ55_9BACT|nr:MULTISPECIES: 2-oxoacid:acceptor oxidoreductase subunit alpha [Geomonas]MBU5638878.1 2-oxoacid:acceptor oxidoreductase subunit alpha [Geomonas diazotrophica]QWV98754.1 2-oxoacid:acceptor oxidoreductase subunit alpha [Geomonas nitrogeniifigens]QXE87911.1 2-oxoacid:acceptor oxidoreductase subunit alpha [Geomonas nitrogeniifigens]
MAKKVAFLQGNEAAAQGALYAGCTFFGGYPITPSTEVAEVMSVELPKIGGKFIQMEDEIGAMASVIGASLTGAKVLTATSGPGLSLKQELIGYACIAETPCVIVNVMRGGPSTGMPTGPSQSDVMCAKWGTHGDHPAICLTPASVQELFEETVRAFNLAEKYRTPVMVMPDEIVAHMRERIVFPDPGELEVINRTAPSVPPAEYKPYDTSFGDVPPLAAFGSGYRFHVTGLNKGQDGFPTTKAAWVQAEEERQVRKVDANIDDIVQFEEYELADAEVAIVAYGSTSRSARFAVNEARKQGIKAGLFRIKTFWPFPEKQIAALAGKVKAFITPEMNLGMCTGEVKRCAEGKAAVHGIFRVDGEPINPGQILEKIKEVK